MLLLWVAADNWELAITLILTNADLAQVWLLLGIARVPPFYPYLLPCNLLRHVVTVMWDSWKSLYILQKLYVLLLLSYSLHWFCFEWGWHNTLKYVFFILSTIYFWLFLLIVGEHIQDLISDLEITKCCAALQIVDCDLFRRQKSNHFLIVVWCGWVYAIFRKLDKPLKLRLSKVKNSP